MPDFNTDPDTDTDADEEDEQDLKQRAKAYLIGAYAYVADAVAQSIEEIAPQLRSVSLPGVSSRAAKSILLAGVLITAAVAMPADPFGGGEASVETQDPVEGETFEPEPDAPSLNGATLNSLPDSFTGSEAEAPEPPDSVRASAGSQTMNVQTDVVDGEPAIVLEDDRTHDGRWVSIDTAWFEEHLGETPSVAYIDHETDGEYAAPLQVRGDSAAFYVREFSTNTVTFDGEVTLSGSQAGDGSQFEYELGNTTGVEDPSINLTGVENTANASTSGVRMDGDSLGIDVGGSADPRDEKVTLTGVEETSSVSASVGTLSNGESGTVDVGGNQPAESESFTFTGVEEASSASASVGPLGDGGSTTIEAGGNQPATNEQVTFVGEVSTARFSESVDAGDGSGTLTLDGPANNVEVEYENTDSLAHYLELDTDGDGSKEIDKYVGSGESGTVNVDDSDITEGSNDWARIDDNYGLKADLVGDVEVTTEDPTVSVDGTSVSYSGVLEEGETATVNGGDISPGSNTIDVSTARSDVSIDLSWTEVMATEDPSVAVGGSTASYSGILTEGETTTVSGGDLAPGSNTVDVSTAGSSVEIDGSWTEVTATEDPSVTVGNSTVSHTGVLSPGQTVTESVDLSTGSQSADVSVTGPVEVAASWTEVTESRDPVVELNGETVSYSGTLADGETVSLSQNSSALVEGTNTVNISTNSPTNGPASLVGFEFSHSAEKEVDATVSETTWSQETNVSRTWPSARSNATATIPMNDRVVDVRNVELRYNGSTWESVAESDYTLNGTDLTVELGDVAEGSTTEVRATGSKVRVADGAVTVLEPTTGSETLDTRIQVDDAGPDFALSVDETVFGDRVHYADNATWGDTTGETTITADGGQTLTLPNATAGAEASVRTWPIEVAPTTGSVTVPELAGERTEPGIAVRGDGNSEVDYTYVNAEDGQPYVLYSQTNEIVRDEGLASSPITLTDDNSDETLVFLVDDGSASGSGSGSGPTGSVGGGGAGPMVDAGGNVLGQLQGIVPSGQTLLLGVGLLGGLFVIGRRTGVITEDRQAAATSAATSAAGTTGSLVERALDNEIVVGALILGAGAFVLATGVLPGDARLIVGLGTAPVAVYLGLQQFGEFDFRVWAGSTIVIALLGMNVLAPTFFETIAQEAGILLAIGGVYLGYRLINAFRAEAETPDEQTNVTFEVDDDDGGN